MKTRSFGMTALALAVASVVTACGGASSSYLGAWVTTTAPYGTPTSYQSTLRFTSLAVTTHAVTVGGTTNGCTITTDIGGVWVASETPTSSTITFTWMNGVDAYSACTASTDDHSEPFTSDKLASINGTASANLSNGDKTLTLTQSFGGTEFTQILTRQ